MIYDAVVVGLGGVGGATLAALAARGARVLGLEQHRLVHDRGSSHGHSRVIRKAYFEHPDYVPLLEVAYRRWAALARRVERPLYLETGVLQVGPPEGEVMQGVLRSARTHGLEVETFDGPDVARRFSGFAAPAAHAAVLERRAGVLRVEACVRAHLDAAVAHGAEVRARTPVTALRPEAHGFSLALPDGVVRARRVIVSVGAWALTLLGELALPLTVLGKTMFWRRPSPGFCVEDGCPAFLFETAAGVFYGLPAFDGAGLKLAEHSGGEPLAAPDAADREVPEAERAAVDGFAARSLPGLEGPQIDAVRCMYTSTEDGHFLLDRHPAQPDLHIIAGLSGHGFKLVPALGLALAERALDGGTDLPVGFLGFRDRCSPRAAPPGG